MIFCHTCQSVCTFSVLRKQYWYWRIRPLSGDFSWSISFDCFLRQKCVRTPNSYQNSVLVFGTPFEQFKWTRMFLLALFFAKPCYGISQGEIVTKDSRRSFPFHVQLAFQQEEGEEIVKPLCGGSLIAERFICSFFRTEILSYLITYNKKYGLFYHFAHSSNLDANAQ